VGHRARAPADAAIEIDEREAIAALKRMREGPPIVMNIDRLSAWHLMQDLQLVLKHPDLPPDGLHAATARALEGFLRNSLCGVNPVLADLAREFGVDAWSRLAADRAAALVAEAGPWADSLRTAASATLDGLPG